jgi:hypothetical protein
MATAFDSAKKRAKPVPPSPRTAAGLPPVSAQDQADGARLLAKLASEAASAQCLCRTPRSPAGSRLQSNGGAAFAATGDVDVDPSTVPDAADAPLEQDHWLRRSVRHAGSDQLKRPYVQLLLAALERNSDAIVVLRLKNWLEADTNSLVLSRVFRLLGTAGKVQALYAQNMDKGMDDERLMELAGALKANKSIWALNVGENYAVTRSGWRKFAAALPDTHVTHLYAGSESTVHGALKVRMRDAVRANRAKHTLHVSPHNIDVIRQIGQMWWNPRNAAAVKALCDAGDERLAISPGARVVYKREGAYVAARVVRRKAASRVLLVAGEGERGAVEWIDLGDAKISASCAGEVVWAELGPRAGTADSCCYWPATLYADVDVLVGFGEGHGPVAASQVPGRKAWQEGLHTEARGRGKQVPGWMQAVALAERCLQ